MLVRMILSWLCYRLWEQKVKYYHCVAEQLQCIPEKLPLGFIIWYFQLLKKFIDVITKA